MALFTPIVRSSPPASTRIVPKNIADLFKQAAERYGDAPAFCIAKTPGSFETKSFSNLYQEGLSLATALIELGVKPRSHIGLIADNRYEWILADCAIQLTGSADVPRGSDITEPELAYILEHADVEVVFVEDLNILEKLDNCKKQRQAMRAVILMNPEQTPPEGVYSINQLLQRGKQLRAKNNREAENRMESILPDDLFTLIYTSGTTGTPKGVQLMHSNMVSQIRNLPFNLRLGDHALSVLPIWHSYERVFQMVVISWGATTYYTTIRTIANDLKTVRPTIMTSAPRLWESIYQRILANVRNASPLRRTLFHAAYFCARKAKRAQFFLKGQALDLHGRSLAESLALGIYHLFNLLLFTFPYRVLDRLVLSKLRQIVGGNFRGTISGGGALQPHVDEFFNFIGIPVLEGYGMTETAPVLAVRTWKSLVIGTVGPPYPETEVRIVDLDSGEILYPNRSKCGHGRGLRGEIHVRGPQVMRGYYKDPESTAKVLRDGWMNTGDIGLITYNNCLKILGRSKETIVLLSGENIEPVPIESRLIQSPLIDQCMIAGQDQKFLSALIIPSLEGFRAAGIHVTSIAEIATHHRTPELLNTEIRRLISAQNGFKPHERIGDWRIIPKSFEKGDELTSTFKIKRHIVTQRYQNLLDDIYS